MDIFDYREAFFSLINIQSGQANMAPRTGAVKYVQTYCKFPFTKTGPTERAGFIFRNAMPTPDRSRNKTATKKICC